MASDTTFRLQCSVPRAVLLGVAAVVGLARSAGAQQGGDSLPPGVTEAMIERGAKVFNGSAKCHACHGPGGTGTEAGPDLTDGVWYKGDGTFEDILARVLHGVSRRDAKTGQPMPMRGWEPASDADVRAVAAYVWSMRQRP